MADLSRFEALTIRSDPSRIREARHWVSALAREEGFGDSETRDLSVAVSEACANIHQHAYQGRPDGRIDIEVEVEHGAVRLSIRDYGVSFDPAHYTPPDLSSPMEGGYGLYLMRSLMDHVEFVATGVGTRVVMVKVRGIQPMGTGEGASDG